MPKSWSLGKTFKIHVCLLDLLFCFDLFFVVKFKDDFGYQRYGLLNHQNVIEIAKSLFACGLWLLLLVTVYIVYNL